MSLYHRNADPPLVRYRDCRPNIRKGDTVLCRLRIRWWMPHDWLTLLIALAAYSRGTRMLSIWQRFVHAGKVVECEGRLMLAEVTAGGGRMIRLSNVVAQWPGKLVIYRPVFTGYDRDAAATSMVDATGKPYGWPLVILLGMSHLLLLGLLARRLIALWGSHLLPVCSVQVARADMDGSGGLSPCPDKPLCLIEPHDLAESSRYRALFVLEP